MALRSNTKKIIWHIKPQVSRWLEEEVVIMTQFGGDLLLLQESLRAIPVLAWLSHQRRRRRHIPLLANPPQRCFLISKKASLSPPTPTGRGVSVTLATLPTWPKDQYILTNFFKHKFLDFGASQPLSVLEMADLSSFGPPPPRGGPESKTNLSPRRGVPHSKQVRYKCKALPDPPCPPTRTVPTTPDQRG